jgi:hypothetical protein
MAGARLLKPPTGLTFLRLAAIISLPALACLVAYRHGSQLGSGAAFAWLQLYAGRAPQAAWPALLHGRVPKAGPIELRRFHPSLLGQCHDERKRWTAAAAGRSNLTEAELPNLDRSPCVECQVFVNHLYKILVLRQPKAASRTLLHHFGLCKWAGRVLHEETGCLTKWEDPALVPTSAEVAARPTYLPLRNLSQAQVADIWKEYFVVTHVRDPFSRAVSQYRHALYTNLAEPAECEALSQEMDWNRVCTSPLELPKLCARRPDCCLQKLTDDVWWKLVHLAPQAACMTTPDGRMAADFVVRWDHMPEDLSELTQQLNARPGVPHLRLGQQVRQHNEGHRCQLQSTSGPLHKAANHTYGVQSGGAWLGLDPKEQYCSMDEYYTGQHAHCKAGIAAYFAEDLRLLLGSSVDDRQAT